MKKRPELGISEAFMSRDRRERILNPFGDADNDGVLNLRDCKPFDPKKHGTYTSSGGGHSFTGGSSGFSGRGGYTPSGTGFSYSYRGGTFGRDIALSSGGGAGFPTTRPSMGRVYTYGGVYDPSKAPGGKYPTVYEAMTSYGQAVSRATSGMTHKARGRVVAMFEKAQRAPGTLTSAERSLIKPHLSEFTPEFRQKFMRAEMKTKLAKEKIKIRPAVTKDVMVSRVQRMAVPGLTLGLTAGVTPETKELARRIMPGIVPTAVSLAKKGIALAPPFIVPATTIGIAKKVIPFLKEPTKRSSIYKAGEHLGMWAEREIAAPVKHERVAEQIATIGFGRGGGMSYENREHQIESDLGLKKGYSLDYYMSDLNQLSEHTDTRKYYKKMDTYNTYVQRYNVNPTEREYNRLVAMEKELKVKPQSVKKLDNKLKNIESYDKKYGAGAFDTDMTRFGRKTESMGQLMDMAMKKQMSPEDPSKVWGKAPTKLDVPIIGSFLEQPVRHVKGAITDPLRYGMAAKEELKLYGKRTIRDPLSIKKMGEPYAITKPLFTTAEKGAVGYSKWLDDQAWYTKKLPETPVLREFIQVGRGAIGAPAPMASYIGMVPSAVEAVGREPGKMAAAFVPGAAFMVKGMVREAYKRPYEFAGEMAGMHLIGKGAGKAAPIKTTRFSVPTERGPVVYSGIYATRPSMIPWKGKLPLVGRTTIVPATEIFKGMKYTSKFDPVKITGHPSGARSIISGGKDRVQFHHIVKGGKGETGVVLTFKEHLALHAAEGAFGKPIGKNTLFYRLFRERKSLSPTEAKEIVHLSDSKQVRGEIANILSELKKREKVRRKELPMFSRGDPVIPEPSIGYVPITAAEAAHVMPSVKQLLLPEVRLRYEGALKIVELTRGEKAPYMKAIDISGIKHIPTKAARGIEDWLVKNKKTTEIYGSGAMRAETIYGRISADLDIAVKNVSRAAKELYDIIVKEAGKKNTRIVTTKRGAIVEVKDKGGEWHHAVDIHPWEEHVPGAVYRYGLKVEKPIKGLIETGEYRIVSPLKYGKAELRAGRLRELEVGTKAAKEIIEEESPGSAGLYFPETKDIAVIAEKRFMGVRRAFLASIDYKMMKFANIEKECLRMWKDFYYDVYGEKFILPKGVPLREVFKEIDYGTMKGTLAHELIHHKFPKKTEPEVMALEIKYMAGKAPKLFAIPKYKKIKMQPLSEQIAKKATWVTRYKGKGEIGPESFRMKDITDLIAGVESIIERRARRVGKLPHHLREIYWKRNIKTLEDAIKPWKDYVKADRVLREQVAKTGVMMKAAKKLDKTLMEEVSPEAAVRAAEYYPKPKGVLKESDIPKFRDTDIQISKIPKERTDMPKITDSDKIIKSLLKGRKMSDLSLPEFTELLKNSMKKTNIIKVVDGYGIYATKWKGKTIYNAMDMKTGFGRLHGRQSLKEIIVDIKEGVPAQLIKEDPIMSSVKGQYEYLRRIAAAEEKYGGKAPRFRGRKGDKVLDVGAGIQPDLRATHAIDLVKPGKKFKSLEYKHGYDFSKESTKLPYKDNTFDVIVSYGALGRNFESLAIYTEIRRVLKPGGRLEFNPTSPKTDMFLKRAGFEVPRMETYFDKALNKEIGVVVAKIPLKYIKEYPKKYPKAYPKAYPRKYPTTGYPEISLYHTKYPVSYPTEYPKAYPKKYPDAGDMFYTKPTYPVDRDYGEILITPTEYPRPEKYPKPERYPRPEKRIIPDKYPRPEKYPKPERYPRPEKRIIPDKYPKHEVYPEEEPYPEIELVPEITKPPIDDEEEKEIKRRRRKEDYFKFGEVTGVLTPEEMRKRTPKKRATRTPAKTKVKPRKKRSVVESYMLPM